MAYSESQEVEILKANMISSIEKISSHEDLRNFFAQLSSEEAIIEFFQNHLSEEKETQNSYKVDADKKKADLKILDAKIGEIIRG